MFQDGTLPTKIFPEYSFLGTLRKLYVPKLFQRFAFSALPVWIVWIPDLISWKRFDIIFVMILGNHEDCHLQKNTFPHVRNLEESNSLESILFTIY